MTSTPMQSFGNLSFWRIFRPKIFKKAVDWFLLKQKESGVYDLRPDIRAKERFVNFTAFVHQAVLNQSVHLIGYTRQLQRPCLTIK